MNWEPSPAPTELAPATLGVICAEARAVTVDLLGTMEGRCMEKERRTGDEDGGGETHVEDLLDGSVGW